MKLQDYREVRKLISRENLEDIMFYINKLKEYEDENKEVECVRIPINIFDEFMTAISMLLNIQYYESNFINNIDFKTK